MRNALTAMGIEIEETGPTSLKVKGGLDKLRTPDKDIFIGNSGTSVRSVLRIICGVFLLLLLYRTSLSILHFCFVPF